MGALLLGAWLNHWAPAFADEANITNRTTERPSIDVVRLEAYVDGVVETVMRESRIPGLVIAIVRSDGALLEKAYGWSNPGEGLAADAFSHPYFIGSISKVFTSTAIMQLVEQGSIALDDDISKYFDKSAYGHKQGAVTIRHLLTHTAGFEERLTNYYGEIPGADRLDTDALLAYMAQPQIRAPDTLIGYSNYAWWLLGEIVSRVTGLSYADYLEQYIFEPLAMPTAGVFPANAEEARLYETVSSHIWRNGDFEELRILDAHPLAAPSGSVRASAADMGRFARMYLNKGELDGQRVLSQTSHAASFAILAEMAPETVQRTPTFWTYSIGAERVYTHTGRHEDFTSHLVIAPDADLAIFAGTNWPGREGTIPLPRQILEYFLGAKARLPALVDDAGFDSQRYSGEYLLTRTGKTRFDRVLWSVSTRKVKAHASTNTLIIGDERFHQVGQDLFQSAYSGNYARFSGSTSGKAQVLSVGDGITGVYTRISYLDSNRSFVHGLGLALLTSVFVLMGAGFQVRGAQLSAASISAAKLEWALRLTALLTLVFAACLALGLPGYIETAELVAQAFPSAILAVGFWSALLASGMTLVCVLLCALEWRSPSASLSSRLFQTLAVVVYVSMSGLFLLWNVVPDPLFV
ncbi:MAG: serine hydrolase domain-containing protein [Pseudomonadota bacterium]